MLRRSLLLCLLVVALATAVLAQPGNRHPNDKEGNPLDEHSDPHLGHATVRDGMQAHDVRLAGHLCYYVLGSILRFPSMTVYRDKVADMERGKSNFRQVAEDMNHFYMMRGETKQSSGEIGLVTFNEVPLPLAKLLFDIRNPEADEKNMNLIGPVETPEGVYVAAAFKRYRKSFFSDAWWDLERFTRGSKMGTSEMLQLIENQDRFWQVSFMIWPEEHVSFKRIKIRQVRADFKKIGMDDPATRMPPPKKKMDPLLHAAKIQERVDFFKKVDPKIIEEHPEIYAMSFEEIRAHGWHPELAAVQRAKERFAEESRSMTPDAVEKEAPKVDIDDFSKRAI